MPVGVLTAVVGRFAALADLTLLLNGPALKRKGHLNGRLADVLSSIFLGTCALRSDIATTIRTFRSISTSECKYEATTANLTVDLGLARTGPRIRAAVRRTVNG